MAYRRSFLLSFLSSFIVDFLSKRFIYENRVYYELSEFLTIHIVLNRGSAFGIVEDFNTGFLIISVFILVVIGFTLKYAIHSLFDSVAFGFIFGGATGNILDRIVYGGVVDFIDLRIGDFHWPTFNLADSFISVAVIFIILKSIIKKLV